MSADFTLDQKRYLEGLATGFAARGGRAAAPTQAKPMGPDAPICAACAFPMAFSPIGSLRDSRISPRPRRRLRVGKTTNRLRVRLYSISTSPKADPGDLSLTVDAVRYIVGKRRRFGVASTFLAERVAPGETLQVYIQAAHGFGLPKDPSTPIIMVGPGTGVAPFRAFLQERAAINATGKNWLFFGHQRVTHDFFYADEFEKMKAADLLTRLSLSWRTITSLAS